MPPKRPRKPASVTGSTPSPSSRVPGSIPGVVRIPHIPPPPSVSCAHALSSSKELLKFKVARMKGDEVQRLV